MENEYINIVKSKFEQMTDVELIDALNNKEQYTQQAIEIASGEYEKRKNLNPYLEETVMEEKNEIVQEKNSQKIEWRNKIISFILFIGFLIIANIFLYYGQELIHMGDNKKINELKSYLDTEKQEITQIEQQIIDLEGNLKSEESNMAYFNENNSIAEYNNTVNSYNSHLATYKDLCNEYDAKIENYNLKVNEYNDLNKKTGTRYYLVPTGRTKSY